MYKNHATEPIHNLHINRKLEMKCDAPTNAENTLCQSLYLHAASNIKYLVI